jgi:glutathione peroxidase
MADIDGFTLKTIDGAAQSLADYRDRVLLVVNVASRCGLTPQYEGLQTLHAEYAPRGLAVLGVPCNQFGGREPVSKVDVNGAARAPLYAWLTAQATRPDGPGDIKWNFAEFLVDRRGAVVDRFDPATAPTAPDVRKAIEQALGA